MGVIEPLVTVQDTINRTAWRTRSALRWYEHLTDWTDPGERAAVGYVSDEILGERLLDVGMGAGRTVPILTRLSADYTGIDYTPELVSICRRNHPDAQVHVMDARNMSAFDDNSFSFVMFSFNGIDSVNNDDRRKILGEFVRVLKPGGIALFSSHNINGPSYRETPIQSLRISKTSDLVKFGTSCARVIYNLPAAVFNYLRYLPLNKKYDGYGVRVCAAHNFGILIQYIDIDMQRQQCAEAGLRIEAIFGSNSGQRITEQSDVTREGYLHFVARKRFL